MPPGGAAYRLIAASSAVRQCLNDAGIAVDDAPVIYPGARVDLFGAGEAWTATTSSSEWNLGTTAEYVSQVYR